MTNQELTASILVQLDQALEQSGMYAYTNKGPSEIMDLPPIVNALKERTAADVQEILLGILEGHEDSDLLLDTLIDALFDVPWFDDIFKDEGIILLPEEGIPVPLVLSKVTFPDIFGPN